MRAYVRARAKMIINRFDVKCCCYHEFIHKTQFRARTCEMTTAGIEETTSDAFAKQIPFDMLAHIAGKVDEPSLEEFREQAATRRQTMEILSPTRHTFTRIICNLLTEVHGLQREHLARHRPDIKYQIIGTRTDRVIVLVVNYIKLIDMASCESIVRAESRIKDIRFQFVSLIDSKPLSCGCLTFDIACRDDVRQSTYAEVPRALRRQRTIDIDWEKTVVEAHDRALVLELIDDVCNLEARMPINIGQWLEGVYSDDCNRAVVDEPNGNGKRARHYAIDDDGDDGTQENNGDGSGGDSRRLIGYCISFTNLPSFNYALLAYLKQKYSHRWASALVVFPSAAAAAPAAKQRVQRHFPQRLVVTLRCGSTLTQTANGGLYTSKRIRTLITSAVKQCTTNNNNNK